MHQSTYLLLFISSLFVAATYANVVSYVYTPACAEGCDFTTPSIWNDTLTATSDVIISSNQSITLSLSDSIFYLNSLTLLGDSPIMLSLFNTTLYLQNNDTKKSGVNNTISWDDPSVLTLNQSFLIGYFASGGNISTTDGALLMELMTFDQLYATRTYMMGDLVFFIKNGVFLDATVVGKIVFDSVIANNTEFDSEVRVDSYLSCTNCTFPSNCYLYLNANASIADFYNTVLDISEINLSPQSLLSFYSDSNNYYFNVNFISYLESSTGSGIHFGDNVQATIQSSNLNNVLLGNNVNLTLGGPNNFGAQINVGNMQQAAGATMTNITIISNTDIASVAPIFVSANVIGVRFTVESLLLAPGSSIYGSGVIINNGLLQCPGSNISIYAVYLTAGCVIEVDTLTTASLGPIQYFDNTINSTIIGNVNVISNVYGLDLYNNTLFVTGNLNVEGGYTNFTISKYLAQTTPRVEVGGIVTFNNVIITATISTLVSNKDEYLLVRSLNKSLSLSNTVIKNLVHNSLYSIDLSTSIKEGDLYMTVKQGGDDKSFWEKYEAIIIGASAGGGAFIIFIIIFGVWKCRSKRHNYTPVR